MRVLAYEYLSTGAMPGAASLLREGLAMLSAVVADLAACAGVEVVTLAAPGLVAALARPGVEVHAVGQGEEESVFRDLARRCDAALVIAPEFDDLLARRAEWALEEGSPLLGPTPLGIRLAGDKLALHGCWRSHGVPTPRTLLLARGECPFAFPVVVKPRFGAGALRTYRLADREAYARVKEESPGELIVQSFAAGAAGSIAFLVGPRGPVPLLPARQDITVDPDGAMHYRGGRLPLAVPRSVIDLAVRAVACVPGLQGYVGVDLVLGEEPTMIEINPRLTTSYIGLRRLARFNVMQAMLDVLGGEPPEAMHYRTGEVAFDLDDTGG
jgi:predicted ATP-grasp superfamily ATP-dependent carboligase